MTKILFRVAAEGCDVLERPRQGGCGILDVDRMLDLGVEPVADTDNRPPAVGQFLGNGSLAARQSAAVIEHDRREPFDPFGTIQIQAAHFVGVIIRRPIILRKVKDSLVDGVLRFGRPGFGGSAPDRHQEPWQRDAKQNR